MFLCLFCVWAHGSVSVCVCHVLHLYHLPVSPSHAPLFSPCLVLVCLIVFTWSSCALLLYIVFLPLVSLLVRFGVYLFHGLRVKLWPCASYFDLAQVIFFFFFVNYPVFVFSLFRFNFNLVFAVPVPFLDLGFLFLLFGYLVWIIYCFYLCFLSCVVLSLVLFVIVFCPALYPDSLTATTWKQLSTLTSQVFGSVSPYLAARLLRSTSCYGVPVVLPIPSSGAAASVLQSATTSDRLSGHPSCPYCVVCPAPLFGLIHYPLSLLFPVNVLSINYNCLLICIWVPFLADPWQLHLTSFSLSVLP